MQFYLNGYTPGDPLVEAPHPSVAERPDRRYVIGCDGSRSGVRAAIGRKLAGDATNQSWGVMDVSPTGSCIRTPWR